MTDDAHPSPTRARPIGRGEHARRRVLAAALDVLAEHGLSGLNMEAVARRAGASKATVYRHWDSPRTLIVDAMDAAFRPVPTPDTGSVRGDLLQVLDRAVHLLSEGPFPRLMAAFIDAAERDPTLAGLHAELTDRRREPLREALDRGRRRGEIPVAADVELAIDLLAAPYFYDRFIARRPLGSRSTAAHVDHVLAALHGAATRASRLRER